MRVFRNTSHHRIKDIYKRCHCKLIYKYYTLVIFKIPLDLLMEFDKLSLKFIWNRKRSVIAQKCYKTKEQVGSSLRVQLSFQCCWAKQGEEGGCRGCVNCLF